MAKPVTFARLMSAINSNYRYIRLLVSSIVEVSMEINSIVKSVKVDDWMIIFEITICKQGRRQYCTGRT